MCPRLAPRANLSQFWHPLAIAMNAQGENIPKVNSNPLKHCFHTKYVLFYVMIMLFTKKTLICLNMYIIFT